MADIEACHKAVGLKIRMIRETLGLSQQELADRMTMERTSVTNIEAGRQRMLLQTIEAFASALGTTPKNLLKGVWW